jgi:four helix bundle protein
MRPHEKLDVWKKSIDITIEIYRLTEDFPKDERFGLTSQIRRASVSIAANIAEGAARRTRKEFINFLSIAQGSASEVETELLIAFKLGYCDKEIYSKIVCGLDEIGRMLTGLSSRLRSKEDV